VDLTYEKYSVFPTGTWSCPELELLRKTGTSKTKTKLSRELMIAVAVVYDYSDL